MSLILLNGSLVNKCQKNPAKIDNIKIFYKKTSHFFTD